LYASFIFFMRAINYWLWAVLHTELVLLLYIAGTLFQLRSSCHLTRLQFFFVSSIFPPDLRLVPWVKPRRLLISFAGRIPDNICILYSDINASLLGFCLKSLFSSNWVPCMRHILYITVSRSPRDSPSLRITACHRFDENTLWTESRAYHVTPARYASWIGKHRSGLGPKLAPTSDAKFEVLWRHKI
jgi:hypothetical protein